MSKNLSNDCYFLWKLVHKNSDLFQYSHYLWITHYSSLSIASFVLSGFEISHTTCMSLWKRKVIHKLDLVFITLSHRSESRLSLVTFWRYKVCWFYQFILKQVKKCYHILFQIFMKSNHCLKTLWIH